MVQIQQNPSRIRQRLIGSLLVIALALTLSFSIVMAQGENCCKDPKSWQEWDALIHKYPNDMDIQFLHALRLGLCAKLERGDLTLNQAIDIFDKYHGAVIREKEGQEGLGDIQGL